jgi:hypothetical protein
MMTMVQDHSSVYIVVVVGFVVVPFVAARIVYIQHSWGRWGRCGWSPMSCVGTVRWIVRRCLPRCVYPHPIPIAVVPCCNGDCTCGYVVDVRNTPVPVSSMRRNGRNWNWNWNGRMMLTIAATIFGISVSTRLVSPSTSRVPSFHSSSS